MESRIERLQAAKTPFHWIARRELRRLPIKERKTDRLSQNIRVALHGHLNTGLIL